MQKFKRFRIISWYIFFIIISSELLLRLVGIIYQQFYFDKNYNRIPKKSYKILCLGDSFTYGSGARHKEDYPSQLQSMLDQKNLNMKFTVINSGIPGNNSSTVVKNLDDHILLYQPDMLIVMIGRNDWWNYTDINVANMNLKIPIIIAKSEAILMRSKFYKLIKIVCLNLQPKYIVNKKLGKTLRKEETALYFMENNRYDDAIDYCQKILAKEPFAANFYIIMAVAYKGQNKFDEALQALAKALEFEPQNIIVYHEIGKILWSTGRWDELFLLGHSALTKGFNNVLFYNFLLGSYPHLSDLNKNKIELIFKKNADYQKVLQADIRLSNSTERGILPKEFVDEITFRNFKKISDICQGKNIKIIFLSYPEELYPPMEKIVKNYNIDFIDLRKHFFKLFVAFGKERYFSYLDGGHCNKNGYRVIAENIVEKIISILKLI